MDIRATPALGPTANAAAAPVAQTPQRRSGAAAPLLDAIAIEIVDGILTTLDGGSERVTLRLLPPPPPGTPISGLAARAEAAAGGLIRLTTALGTIQPQRPVALTPGSMVRLELLSRVPITGPAHAVPAPPPPMASELAAMLAVTPDALLPEPGSDRLGAVLQLLLAAAPAGAARLRQTTERSAEHPTARSDGTGPPLGGGGGETAYWRVIPLAWPYTGITNAYLLRREPSREEGEDGEEPARFMLEFSLPHLGTLQLDGLYRRGRFDLLLRSHAPLPPEIRAGATGRFHAALARGAVAGGVAFAALVHFPVTAIPPPQSLGIEV